MDKEKRLSRNKDTQEFFTPDSIVTKLIKEVPEHFFKMLEPYREIGCGTGNITIAVYNKFRKYHTQIETLKHIYLIDIMKDNCIHIIKLLYNTENIITLTGNNIPNELKSPGLKACFIIDGTLSKNIVCADGTAFTWWEPEQYANDKITHTGLKIAITGLMSFVK